MSLSYTNVFYERQTIVTILYYYIEYKHNFMHDKLYHRIIMSNFLFLL